MSDLIIHRVHGPLRHATFTIPAVHDLLGRYIHPGDHEVWADPYAGEHGKDWVSLTNDINPSMPTMYHLDALDFAKLLHRGLDGVLIDPPYSYRQVSEHYRMVGRKATSLDTSYNFYHRVMKVLAPKIRRGGFAISFGWNSNGFPKTLGFEKVEVLLIAHGGHHQDSIVTVDRKL
jgi:hypothetical protein